MKLTLTKPCRQDLATTAVVVTLLGACFQLLVNAHKLFGWGGIPVPIAMTVLLLASIPRIKQAIVAGDEARDRKIVDDYRQLQRTQQQQQQQQKPA